MAIVSSIVEKSNAGLFENEIEFNGKYATIVRHLKNDLNLFTTFREAYVTAAIVGLLNGKKGSPSTEDTKDNASIFPNELSKRKPDLRFLYRIIMLVDDVPGYSIDDYMNRAFRFDSEDEDGAKLKENMALFHSYVCGGLDFLNDKFGNLDRIDDVTDTLYEWVHSIIDDLGYGSAPEELPIFAPIFD